MRVHTNVIKCDHRSMHVKVAQNLYRCVKVYEGNKALMTVSASGVLYNYTSYYCTTVNARIIWLVSSQSKLVVPWFGSGSHMKSALHPLAFRPSTKHNRPAMVMANRSHGPDTASDNWNDVAAKTKAGIQTFLVQSVTQAALCRDRVPNLTFANRADIVEVAVQCGLAGRQWVNPFFRFRAFRPFSGKIGFRAKDLKKMWSFL